MSQAEDLLKSLSVAADVPTVSVEPVNHMLLTDTATGKIYKVTVSNGQLNIAESIN